MNLSAPDREQLNWRKASASISTGACVELAESGQTILVRDSKDPAGPLLTYRRAEIHAFLDGVRKGEFDDLLGS